MQIFPVHHLKTMQHLPRVGKKLVGYGVASTLALGAGVTWIVV